MIWSIGIFTNIIIQIKRKICDLHVPYLIYTVYLQSKHHMHFPFMKI